MHACVCVAIFVWTIMLFLIKLIKLKNMTASILKKRDNIHEVVLVDLFVLSLKCKKEKKILKFA